MILEITMFNFIHDILVPNSIYIFSIFTFTTIHLYGGVRRTDHICKARYRCSFPARMYVCACVCMQQYVITCLIPLEQWFVVFYCGHSFLKTFSCIHTESRKVRQFF